ncbi:CHAD domain-containing protein [Tahibacter aquaticus]|uniref:CHAD domain-containing protein n=1 Tax=Tahibacter aquaticus TaxID=520092 RepID=A0A4R6Z063_9GAMM|nr:CHAD domain-containing protein [Tahibacter aquaticus]TDR44878.1 CHAD domain-containing protein [Tahibacter aquaticus]
MLEDHDPLPPGDVREPPLSAALQAYALDQLIQMEAQLRRRGRQRHAGIHEARKAARRFRSVVLLGTGAAQTAAAEAAVAIRLVCKRLSRLRDAHVVSELASAGPAGLDAASMKLLRQRLKQVRDELAEELLQRDPELRRKRRKVHKARTALLAEPWPALSAEGLLLALRRNAARMHKAQRDAEKTDSLALRHRWRRRVRRLRVQLQILAEIGHDKAWPATTRAAAKWVLAEAADCMPSVDELRALGDALGQQQDRALLRSAVRRAFGPPQREVLLQLLQPGRSKKTVRP